MHLVRSPLLGGSRGAPVLAAAGRGCDGVLPLAPQNVYAPEQDPQLQVERYERSFAQNEDLGLNDMRTEGYELDPPPGPAATPGR